MPGPWRGAALTRLAAAAALLLAACACYSSKLDVIQVGPWFAPRDWRSVQVFTSRDQAARPWGGIAIIHASHIPASADTSSLEKLERQARRRAAAIGADAVIITFNDVPAGDDMGVVQEPERYLSALAIKYVTAVSTGTAK